MLALDEAIWGFHDSQTLSPDEERARDEIIDRLQACLFCVCPNATLHPYGSQATGLQTKSSDIDLGFVFPPDMEQAYQQQSLEQKREMVTQVLKNMATELSRNEWIARPVLEAPIPIVKCADTKTGVEVDIARLESNALINADHIRQYIQIDCRVRPLLLAVKHWAKMRGINESTRGTLNSFGYCLMVIQYLQIVVPPVLPVLDIRHASVEVPSRSFEQFRELQLFWQNTSTSGAVTPPENRKVPATPPPLDPKPEERAKAPEERAKAPEERAKAPEPPSVAQRVADAKTKPLAIPLSNVSGSKRAVDTKTKPLAIPFESKNGTCVADLLFGFFQFYSNFDINNHCVDTNSGRLIEKSLVSIHVRRSALSILDPTDPENNVARSVRRWEWQSMETEIKLACEVIKKRHHLGQACFDELTELVETSEQQYRRVWQKTQVLARIRAEMEQYHNQQKTDQYQREMTKALWQVGLRPRSFPSHSSGGQFTPSNYTPTSDTPQSVHSGQFTPSVYSLTKSPSYSFTPTGTVTPPIGPMMSPWSEGKSLEEEPSPGPGPTSPTLQPLEPTRSASGSGVPYNSMAYQNTAKPAGRFHFARINKMPAWSHLQRRS